MRFFDNNDIADTCSKYAGGSMRLSVSLFMAMVLLISFGRASAWAQTSGLGPFTLSAPTDASDHQWYKDGVALTGETGSSYDATQPGVYWVEFVDETAGLVCTGKSTDSYSVVIQEDSSVTTNLNGLSGYSNYQWYKDTFALVGGDNISITLDTDVNVVGQYYLTYDGTNCTITSELFDVYLLLNQPPTITAGQTFSITSGAANNTVLNGISDLGNGIVDATEPDTDLLQNWQITGDSSNNGGGGVFAIDANGELTVADSATLLPGTWRLTLTVDDDQGNTSVAETVAIFVPIAAPICAVGETPVMGYANIANQTGGAVNKDNAVGAPDGAYAVLANGEQVSLDLSDTVPAGETIYIIMARNNTTGQAEIHSSLTESGWGNLVNFNAGTTGIFRTVQYTSPAAGTRWMRVRRTNQSVRVDAVAYAFCQALAN